jgi:hypothetical protein
VDKKIITDDPVQGFLDWILFKLNKEYTSRVFAHAGGRFDTLITYERLMAMGGMTPSAIRRGTKFVSLKVEKRGKALGETEFIDSYNLLPVALGKLVGTFDLKVWLSN